MSLDTVPHDVTVDDAEASVVETTPLRPHTVPVREASGCWLASAPGVAAGGYVARWDLPSASVSVMDGWAVRAADLEAANRDGKDALELRISGESAAGHPRDAPLRPGEVAQVSTGAVVPAGADAVVPREEGSTRRAESADDVRVVLDAAAVSQTRPGRYVRPAGSDVARGELLLEAGVRVGPGEFALLAGAGVWEVSVHPRPRVAIVGTGDELVPVGTIPRRGQVVSTNVDMLAAQVRAAGATPTHMVDVPDERHALHAALATGLEADVLVTTGGASVGDHDLVFEQLRRLGYRPRFVRVRLRPGRPTVFGFVDDTPVLMLPGNPASSHVAFELFGVPLLRRLGGCPRDGARTPRREMVLAEDVQPMRSRDKYDRARVAPDGRVVPLAQQQSGALRSIANYDVLMRVPAGTETLRHGSSVEVIEVVR